MEFALPELLSRGDILRILNERQLPIQDMKELTHDELLRIYKTFVMPLSRRPQRTKKIKPNFIIQPTNGDCVDQNMQLEHFETSCNLMDIDFPHLETCHVGDLRSSSKMTSPVCEKRRQRSSEEDCLDINENDYQYQLSSVTKRIRINSLS